MVRSNIHTLHPWCFLEASRGRATFMALHYKGGGRAACYPTKYSNSLSDSNSASYNREPLSPLTTTSTMSLTHQFIREFAPVFRILEDPFRRSHYPSSNPVSRHGASPFGTFFNDPFFNRGAAFELNAQDLDIRLTEYSNEFVARTLLPGVKKENVEIKIGDGGQSLTIGGKSFVRSASNERPEAPATTEVQASTVQAKEGAADAENASTNDEANQAVAQTNTNASEVGRRLTSERVFSSTSSFSQTVWLPRRVDGSKVKAKLEDGILTLHIPKAEDPETVRITVE